MKICVSKSNANPGRKYWKCKYWGKEDGCHLYHWDDEFFGERETSLIEGEIIELVRKMEKEFGKWIGIEPCSKEMEDLKKNIGRIRKKMDFVIVVVISFWFFSSRFRIM
jgi:hypothetical protein